MFDSIPAPQLSVADALRQIEDGGVDPPFEVDRNIDRKAGVVHSTVQERGISAHVRVQVADVFPMLNSDPDELLGFLLITGARIQTLVDGKRIDTRIDRTAFDTDMESTAEAMNCAQRLARDVIADALRSAGYSARAHKNDGLRINGQLVVADDDADSSVPSAV